MARPEVEVDIKAPMPKGYGFLKKGDTFRSGRCRKLTHEAGKTLYVVTKNRKRIGLRAPKHIISEVWKADELTKASRQQAVERRDKNTQDDFEAAVLRQFPKIPREEVLSVLKHTLQKRSRRVGRTGQLTLDHKARLAVTAHIRHCHTKYDEILKGKDATRLEAREEVQKDVIRILRSWGGEPLQEGKRNRRRNRKEKKSQKLKTSKPKLSPSDRPKTRSQTKSAGNSQPEVLEILSSDEGDPIIISSDDAESEAEELYGSLTDEEAECAEAGDVSDDFIVDDTKDDSSDEFSLDLEK